MERRRELESQAMLALARALGDLNMAAALVRVAPPPNEWIDIGIEQAKRQVEEAQSNWILYLQKRDRQEAEKSVS